MDPLRRRGVDLDPVTEPEQPLGPRPEPDERVKRRQERTSINPPGPPRLVPQVRRHAPSPHRNRDELASLDKLGDPLLGVRPRETEVVTEVRFGGDAERAGGD